MANTPAYIPTDPLLTQQWHLLNSGNTEGSVAGHDINVVNVWPQYTGRGILVGVLDDGMDDTHPDLIANYRHDLAWDVDLNQPGATVRHPSDAHGVAVAGLIAATNGNGLGGVGVAWGSSFTMHRIDLHDTTNEKLLKSFELSARKMVSDGIDISSNSWGPGSLLQQQWLIDYQAPTRYMSEFGRDGLGIVSLFAGGNDRERKMNTNYDPTDNSPWSIIVAASHQNGGVTAYSTPGASVLITAPGSGSDLDPPASIVTTDRQSSAGYNRAEGVAGDYFSEFNGTSAATPIAAGVVALMLEANAGLGYRDVQEILAYSANRAAFLQRDEDRAFNGARDWNGGALMNSHDFGYGNIDAHAAVRLAESWTKVGKAANLVLINGEIHQHQITVGSGATAAVKAGFAAPYRVEQVTVTVNIEADSMDGLTLQLVSPSGTVSKLVDFPTGGDDDDDDFDYDDDDDFSQFHYTLNTVLSWGESLAGEWTLTLGNQSVDQTFMLKDWAIQAFTAGQAVGGTQIFTNEFGTFVGLDSGRSNIDATNGSNLNAAIVTENVRFDLSSGVSWIGNHSLTLTDPANFRNLVSGDGDDTLIGNSAGNVLMAGRGNNHLDGGAGVDVARFLGSSQDYSVGRHTDFVTIQSPSIADHGTDILYNVEVLHFKDQVVLTQAPQNLGTDLFDERGYLSHNPDVAAAVKSGQISNGSAHYSLWGAKEGRNPNALFDEQWYLSNNSDVARAVDAGALNSGFAHYQQWGWAESRTPSAWMDTKAYLAQNADVAAAAMNPLLHYMLYGAQEGRVITAHETDLWA